MILRFFFIVSTFLLIFFDCLRFDPFSKPSGSKTSNRHRHSRDHRRRRGRRCSRRRHRRRSRHRHWHRRGRHHRSHRRRCRRRGRHIVAVFVLAGVVVGPN